MSSLALRAFIRESLVLEIGGSPGQDLRYAPTIPGTREEQVDLMLGKPGTFVVGNTPDYVVIGDNPGINKLVVRRHSSSDATPSEFLRRISGQSLMQSDPITKALLNKAPVITTQMPKQDSWYILEPDQKTLKVDAGSPGLLMGPGYYVIARDTNILTPQREYTKEFQDAVDQFLCPIELSEAIDIIRNKDVTSPEWALAAGCFYEYANSFTASVVGTVAGALIGAAGGAAVGAIATGGVGAGALAGTGAKYGAIWGPVASDVLLRSVTMYWAAKNGRTAFFWANAVYVCIILLFGGLATYASKVVPIANTAAGTQAVVGAVNTLSAAIPTVVTPTAKQRILAAVSQGVIGMITEFVTNIIASMFTGITIQADNEQVAALVGNPQLVDAMLADSRAQLQKYIQDTYKKRE